MTIISTVAGPGVPGQTSRPLTPLLSPRRIVSSSVLDWLTRCQTRFRALVGWVVGTQGRGEPSEAVWTVQRCRLSQPPPLTARDYGGNRQPYHIQWLQHPGSGAWVEACSEWDLTGMICWCPSGALLVHTPGTTLRCWGPRERGCRAHDDRSSLDRS